MNMSLFETEKRKRNLADGYHETKGLKDGHCNRSACQRELKDQPQYYMTDFESHFNGARLYYCVDCAHDFTAWDIRIGAPIRCTLDPDTVWLDWPMHLV